MLDNNPDTKLKIRKVGAEISMRKKGSRLLAKRRGKKLSIRQIAE